MKCKLSLLVVFTAAVSFACASASQMVREDTRMGRQEPPMKTRATGSYKPITVQQTELVLGGKCVAKLTYDQNSGDLIKVETDSPCRVTEDHLLVNGQEVLDLSGSITFGRGTKNCRVVFGRLQCVCADREC
jgi:hypothetical protein